MPTTNKERLTLNFKKNPVTTIEKINELLSRINDKKRGREITLHDVIGDCVANYTSRDIERLQEASLSPMDRVRGKFERDMAKSGSKLSFEEYLAKKVGAK